MSTRGNVVFLNYWTIEEMKENNKTIDFENLTENSEEMKNCYEIYIHSDMYPSGALPDLQEFLKMKGARHRGTDTSYLSAWFIAYSCMNQIPYTLAMTDFDKYRDTSKTRKCFGNMKKSRDWFGVGLQNELSDWAEYTYVIVPNIAEKGHRYDYKNTSFDIYIYYGALDEYVSVINSKTNLKTLEDKDWWD